MTAQVQVEVGTVLPPLTVQLTRTSLVRYAGAAGDFNPIHFNDRSAAAIGLPGVVAHGMLTMAEAVRVVTDWVGDPARVLEYTVRFTKPVVVPDDDTGAALTITGKVAAIEDGDGADRRVRVDITAVAADQKVLGQARAVVRLS